MDDPWKHPAFAVAGIAAFVTADYTGPMLGNAVGLENWAGAYIAAGLTGIVLGFIIDDMLPVYLEHQRNGGSSLDGGGDMDMDSGDLDF